MSVETAAQYTYLGFTLGNKLHFQDNMDAVCWKGDQCSRLPAVLSSFMVDTIIFIKFTIILIKFTIIFIKSI